MNRGKLFSVFSSTKPSTHIMFRPNNEISQSALARKVTEENRFYKVYLKKKQLCLFISSLYNYADTEVQALNSQFRVFLYSRFLVTSGLPFWCPQTKKKKKKEKPLAAG